MLPRRFYRLAVVSSAAFPSLLVAQGNVDRAGFVVCLGSDTLAVERYTRSATMLSSEIIIRAPAARRVVYTASLDAGGSVRHFDITLDPLVPGPLAPAPTRGSLWFRGDTAEMSLTLGDSTRTLKVAARPGSVPLAAFSHALVEQAILHAQRAGRDTLEFDWVGMGASKAYPTYVTRKRDGSIEVGFFNAPALVTVDGQGRILTLDGRATTSKVQVRRVKEPDLQHFASSFAAAEAARGPVGQLSPRDTAWGRIGDAHVMVDYGRPWKRGRRIFGQVVPWNRVWRTGANEATELVTDATLHIGGQIIPPGVYGLWSIPRHRGATLIVSRRTGVWGTEYQPGYDQARIELSRETPPEAVEQFTIGIEPQGEDAGVLRLSWDSVSYQVPFTIERP